MDYVVLDLEWNQSPDGKETSVENLPFEIIELGAVKLDGGLRKVDTFHRLICPSVYQQMHFKISEVTHLDMERLRTEGISFKQAAQEFLDWCGESAMFCTWGPMDLSELQRNMDYYHMDHRFPKPFLYYDIQKLYSILFKDGKQRLSLDQAVKEQGMNMEQPFHQAQEDARYTAEILAKMGFDSVREYVSIDYYQLPKSCEEEIYLCFSDYSKYVSRVFDIRESVIEDKNVSNIVCYRCQRMLRKKIRWFTANQRSYHALACCPEHGWLKGKIRIKKTDQGNYFAVKTLKLIKEEDIKAVYEKRDEYRQKRNQKNRLKRLKKKNTS